MEPEGTDCEYIGDLVKVKLHRKPDCVVELEVDVSQPLVVMAREKAAKSVGKGVVISGFRKGKAPIALVEQSYPGRVEEGWRKVTADLSLAEVWKLVEIRPFGNEAKVNYNIKTLSSAGGKVLFFFETEPRVPSVDPKEVLFRSVERPEVSAEKIEETIRQVRFFFADWKTVVDRGVQEGDCVTLDLYSIEEEPPRKIFADTRFEVVDRSMAQWMKGLVIGHRTGETLEGMSIPDSDASVEDQQAYHPQKVRVVIKSVEEVLLPELNDSFAVRVGANSVEEMRGNITKLLNHQADGHVAETQRKEVSEILLQKYPFDVPLTLVQQELEFRLQQLMKDQEYLTHWQSMTKDARRRAVASLAELSKDAVRMFYLSRKILSDAGIAVSPEERTEGSGTFLEFVVQPKEDEKVRLSAEAHKAEVFEQGILTKALNYVITQSKQE